MVFFVALFSRAGEPSAMSSPTAADWAELIGQPASGIKKIIWQASAPPATNLWIYEVSPPKFDEENFRWFARCFGVDEPIVPTSSTMSFSGFWMKEKNPTNVNTWRSVIWTRAGLLGYHSGDDGWRWDLKNHRPLMNQIPTHQEAMGKTIAMLPALGLATNDLELNEDGSFRQQFSKDKISYTDPGSKERREAVQKRTLTLFQRVPNGGSTISIGDGGALQVSFISDGKIADLEFFFRALKPLRRLEAMTSAQLADALENQSAWTFKSAVPEILTVTNCALAYPQGNSSYRQNVVWPVYALTGVGVMDGETNRFNLFVPLSRQSRSSAKQ